MASSQRAAFIRMGTDAAPNDIPSKMLEADDHTPFLEESAGAGPSSNRLDNGTKPVTYGISTVRRWMSSPVWFITSLVLLSLLLFQAILLVRTSQTYGVGFHNEIAALKPAIQLTETRFKSAILTFPNGTMYVPDPSLDSKGRLYAGPPSDEIDAAWHDLLYGRYVRFTDEEVLWLNSDSTLPSLTPITTEQTRRINETGYYGGPDMLHSLHCVNSIRKHLDYDHYANRMPMFKPALERLHINHCLEQLRQAILCHGDLTPVTLKPVWNEELGMWILLGETERQHTCRDGHAIAKAWRERATKTGYLRAE